MVLTLTGENFKTEVLDAELPVLVDFWAPWCPPCRLLGPIVEEFAEEFSGRVKVGKLNVDEAPIIAQEYNIMSIPTLKFFRDGHVVSELVGLRSKDELRKTFESVSNAKG